MGNPGPGWGLAPAGLVIPLRTITNLTTEASENSASPRRSTQAWVNYALGVVVFALGIVLMLLAFAWGYRVFQSVDEQMSEVQVASAVETPASNNPGEAADSTPPVVRAEPPQGPTLVQVILGIVIKLVTLLILAGIGGMIASRGAHLAGAGARAGG